jgi:hypothetical protein
MAARERERRLPPALLRGFVPALTAAITTVFFRRAF